MLDDHDHTEPNRPAAPMLAGDPLVGSRVNSYVISEKIGEGGMGAVYLGVQPEIGKRVAIKFLAEELNGSPELVQRFFQEARAVNVIGHENIVDIFDFGRTPEGRNFCVMELLEGPNLERLLSTENAQSTARTVDVARQVASALYAAHENGIVHRDLKPDNVFLLRRAGRDNFVKVLDFGIAKLTATVDDGSVQRTQSGAILGTPGYMAPEQAGGGVVDHRADIYALGVMMYRMLAGRLPFEGKSLAEIFRRQLMEDPVPLGRLRADVPRALDALILRMMNREPDARPATMAAVEKELGALPLGELSTSVLWYAGPLRDVGALSVSGPGAPAPGQLEIVEEPTARSNLSRKSSLPSLMIGALLIAAAAGVTLYTRSQHADPAPVPAVAAPVVPAPAAPPEIAKTPAVAQPQAAAAAGTAQPAPAVAVAAAPVAAVPVAAAAPVVAAPVAAAVVPPVAAGGQHLHLVSDPAGAQVLDKKRRQLGTTPGDVLVEAGAAPLLLKLAGYREERVEVAAGQTSISVSLHKLPKAEPRPRESHENGAALPRLPRGPAGGSESDPGTKKKSSGFSLDD